MESPGYGPREREGKTTAVKGEKSAMMPSNIVLFTGSSQGSSGSNKVGRPRKPVPVWTQSAVGHFHVSEEKGNKLSRPT